ncbi:FERM domain-containing protein 5 isoform X1 [Schistocerca gregaria]|uniref:FERM domain-containing protein 5 isoform X1 n=1 Tax=Schistocerca gregaria TaxID=7010 RepID=UPI00211DC342|nr:FERM domain-containing protein 5 isoform X1 [Schistocerca gregaria]
MLKFGSKSDINVSYKCTVRLLEDTEIVECEFQNQHKGKYLLEYVCRQLNLAEKDYFGLRYVDATRQRHWLDPAKSVIKQVKDMDPILFSFRVKFYPPDPFRLKEEITRYQIYLQLKRDLLHGRLYCTPSEAALLAAYIIQSELGDYDPEEHEDNYVSDFKLLLKQTPEIEGKIMELHQTQLRGQTPAQTETNFLRKACQLDTYGVDPHPVKDHRGNQLYLGINHCGILTFQGSRKTHHFRWSEVQKINYEGKMFIVHLTYNEKKHTVGFKCPTGAACRHVWRCAIEQMLFFTLPSSSEAPSVVTGGSFFSWGTKFRYTGRVEKEILEDSGPLRKEEPSINRNFRSSSLRRKASSVPATPSTPIGSELGEIRYGSLPRANHSAPTSDARLDASGNILCGSDVPLSSPYCTDSALPLLETVAEDQEITGKHRLQAEDIDAFIKHEKTQNSPSRTSTTQCMVPCTSTPKGDIVYESNLDNGFEKQQKATEEKNVTDGIKEPFQHKLGLKDGENVQHGFDDYYFRDSFEHSSSESQLMELGLKQTHLGTTPTRTQPPPIQAPPTSSQVGLVSAQHSGGTNRRFNIFRVFVPSFLVVVASLVIGTVFILELDCETFSTLRRWPEMVVLRHDYYEPMKEYLRRHFVGWLS